MDTKLRLTHDEIVILTAIADQELTFKEIKQELGSSFQEVFKGDRLELVAKLQSMIDDVYIERSSPYRESIFQPIPDYLFKIAPEILALNHPPYSYENWRALSDQKKWDTSPVLLGRLFLIPNVFFENL
jgi:hypothetical protein